MKRLLSWYEGVLFLPALLPLLYVQGMMYPLMTPKTLALRGLGIVLLALFSYLAFNGKQFYWNRLRRKETWIPGALLILAYLASLGGGFYHSFWSTFERGDGLVTLTVCVGYFYLLLISAECSWMRKLFKMMAWVGSIAALYLVLQWTTTVSSIDLPFIVLPNGRVGGTMGNAAFLAAYLGMAFFATLAAAREYSGWWRRTLYVGAGLQVFAILLTATRGTQLALACVVTTALLYAAVVSEGKVRRYARAGLLAACVVVGLFFVLRPQIAQIPFEPIQRIATISLSDATVSSRLFLWGAISREAIGHSLLGYGAENIDVPFDAVYDPAALSEEWFDRSHNAYLDYFVQFGIAGILLYLALIAFIARTGWKLWKSGNQYGLPLLGIIGTYAVQNFFVFDTGVTLWLLFALAATTFIACLSHEDQLQKIEEAWPATGALVGVFILILLYPVVVLPLRANFLSFESYQYQIVDVPRSNAAATKALSLGTYADLELGFNAYFMYTEEQMTRLTGSDLLAAYANAVALLSNAFERYPNNARVAVYLAQTLSLAPPNATVDKNLLASAIERSIRLSPKRSQPWYILVNLSISEANKHAVGSSERSAGYAAARDLLARYIALVPNLSEPHYVLAQLLWASADTAGAKVEAEKGRKYYTEGLSTARRAVKYYETVLDLPNAAFFLAEVVRLDPTDTAARSDLQQIQAYEQTKK